jgi:hypothetical protein
VREHLLPIDVPNRVNVRNVGPHHGVDRDQPIFCSDADRLEADVFDITLAPNRDQQDFGLNDLFLTPAIVDSHPHAGSSHFDVVGGRA